MKTHRKILIAFLLNLGFSVFEFFGGMFTGSISIVSDAVHDMGDAISIGLSWFLEKKSGKKPDDKYTFGYRRFSVLGAFITNSILIAGSVGVIFGAVQRIITPVSVDCNGMLLLATFGIAANLLAALITKGGTNLNQKAVSLHMLEDVLGWIAVFIGSVVIKFTGLIIVDPVLCICVSAFVLVSGVKGMKQIAELFLDKAPEETDVQRINSELCKIKGVLGVHHIHLRSIDGETHFATMHIVTNAADTGELKHRIKDRLIELGVAHTTLELEQEGEPCGEEECKVYVAQPLRCTHHHHH